jgi:hypothetical protein
VKFTKEFMESGKPIQPLIGDLPRLIGKSAHLRQPTGQWIDFQYHLCHSPAGANRLIAKYAMIRNSQ